MITERVKVLPHHYEAAVKAIYDEAQGRAGSCLLSQAAIEHFGQVISTGVTTLSVLSEDGGCLTWELDGTGTQAVRRFDSEYYQAHGFEPFEITLTRNEP